MLLYFLGVFGEIFVLTSIVVLASLDFAATFLLLGAQVIAEYERIGTECGDAPPPHLHT